MGAAGDPVSRSVPALDGIRGLAILSVVWFHFLPGQMPGGWMGMSIFFPLSGFLVTRLLLDGIEQHHVDVLAFWERRARRLLPALWVMLAITSMLPVASFAFSVPGRRAATGARYSGEFSMRSTRRWPTPRCKSA